MHVIICSAGLAFCCWRRLMSNVRPRGKNQFMHLPASSSVFMNALLRSPCGSPASKGSGRWHSRQKAWIVFRGFSIFVRRSLPCEAASRQEAGSSVVAQFGALASGFGGLCAHRSRLFHGARGPHAWAGAGQSATQPSAARQLRIHGRWHKQSRFGTAWPNPSIKPSPNSEAPGPRYSALSLVLQRGPGASLLVPAYVER